MTTLMSPDELEAKLRKIGATRYHNLHPFHKMLHGGELNKMQVQAWALNRYYYQCMIPIKDAALMSRIPDPAIRREWRHRLEDHDGGEGVEGGIDRWFKLTDGLGLDREYVKSTKGRVTIIKQLKEPYSADNGATFMTHTSNFIPVFAGFHG